MAASSLLFEVKLSKQELKEAGELVGAQFEPVKMVVEPPEHYGPGSVAVKLQGVKRERLNTVQVGDHSKLGPLSYDFGTGYSRKPRNSSYETKPEILLKSFLILASGNCGMMLLNGLGYEYGTTGPNTHMARQRLGVEALLQWLDSKPICSGGGVPYGMVIASGLVAGSEKRQLGVSNQDTVVKQFIAHGFKPVPFAGQHGTDCVLLYKLLTPATKAGAEFLEAK